MKTTGTRIFSLLLCLVLVLTLVPTTVFAGENYGVWVNGEEFSSNKQTISCGDGTATYNPAKAELTLENAVITQTTDIPYYTACIVADPDITIVVKGENTVTNDKPQGIGISANGDMTITGDGSLKVETPKVGIAGKNVTLSDDGLVKVISDVGVSSKENMRLCGGGDLNIEAGYYGIDVKRNLTISEQRNIYIIASEEDAISAAGTVTVTGSGDLTLAARMGGIVALKDLVFAGSGTLTAIASGGLISYENLTLSGSGDMTLITGYTGLTSFKNTTINRSGYLTIVSSGTGVNCTGNLTFSCRDGIIDIYGEEVGVVIQAEDGQVLLNGVHNTIQMSTVSGKKAVYNNVTGTSPVAGTRLSLYDVTGTPDSDSVLYTFKSLGSMGCGGDPGSCALALFTDAPKYTNWAHRGIEYCVLNGLMSGTSATTFEPKTPMSRAMLVTVLYRMEGEPGGGRSTFMDVKPGKWFSDAVSWAADNGIVTGVGGGRFDPSGNVSREQIATILYRYAAYKGYDTSRQDNLTGFADSSTVGKWFVDGMKWAAAEGLITGTTSGRNTYLNPQGDATREQVAAILMRFCENTAK